MASTELVERACALLEWQQALGKDTKRNAVRLIIGEMMNPTQDVIRAGVDAAKTFKHSTPERRAIEVFKAMLGQAADIQP